MIKIYIFADSYKHFDKSIGEYEKRLGKSLKIFKLKPTKFGEDSKIIEDETNKTIELLKKDKGFKIVLSPLGKQISTLDFSDFIESKKQNYGDISFYIGGANGFNYSKLRSYIDLELSLSSFTMPHSLALLVLLEQIYRIDMIKKGTSYNK